MNVRARLAWHGRPWLIALGILALANLVAGVVMSLAPERTADLWRVLQWTADWISGQSPYRAADSLVDYPPWALPLLVPIALVARVAPRLVAPGWVVVNLACLAWLVRSLVALAGHPKFDRALMLMLVCGACAASRTLSQFTLPAFACALAGAISPSRVGGPLLVGIGLVKPQIGGVVWVWLLLERRWRVALAALAVPLFVLLVFSGWVHESPASVLARYRDVLEMVHGGADPFVGHTEVTSWLTSRWPHLEGLWPKAGVAVIALIPAVWVAIVRRRAATVPARRLIQLTQCGAASLLAVRHLSYDFVMLLPLVAACTAEGSATRHTWLRRAAFGLLVAYLVVEPASVWRHLGTWTPTAAGWGPGNVDRVFTLGVWLSLSLVELRLSPKSDKT